MQKQINKKIYFYIFLFIFLGTFNNKNLKHLSLPKISEIKISGLNNENNLELMKGLNFLKFQTLFILNENKIKNKIESNNLVEKFYVFKKYPSSLEIKIIKTKILAKIKKDGKVFFLGSNGKFIENQTHTNEVPYIFGDFSNKEFFELKSIIDNSEFNFKKIKNLFFFKSGRWDLETNSGILIRLPRDKLLESVKLLIQILKDDEFKNAKIIDLRQYKQLIINE